MNKFKYLFILSINIFFALLFLYGAENDIHKMVLFLKLYTIGLCIHLLYSSIDFAFIRGKLSLGLEEDFSKIPLTVNGLNVGCSLALMIISLSGFYTFNAGIVLFVLSFISLIIFLDYSIYYFRRYKRWIR